VKQRIEIAKGHRSANTILKGGNARFQQTVIDPRANGR
jgi:hypothetical protein